MKGQQMGTCVLGLLKVSCCFFVVFFLGEGGLTKKPLRDSFVYFFLGFSKANPRC